MFACSSCKNCVGLGKDSYGNLISRRCSCRDLPFEGAVVQNCRFYVPRNVQNVPPQKEKAYDEMPRGNNVNQAQSVPASQNIAPQGRPAVPQNGAPQGRPAVPQNSAPQGRPAVPQNGAPQGRPSVPQNTAPQERPAVPQNGAPQGRPVAPQNTAPQGRPVAPQNTAPQERPPVPQNSTPQGRPVAPQNTAPQERPPVPQQNAAAPGQKPKKKKAGAVVAIILVVILLIVGVIALGVGGFFVYNKFVRDKNPDVNIGEVVTDDAEENEDFFVYEYDHSKNEGKTGVFFDYQGKFDSRAYIKPAVGLNLRLAPNENGMRIKIMAHMDEVYVFAYLNEWAFVEHDGDYGWCSAEFLDQTDTKVTVPEKVRDDLLYTKEEITPVRVAMGDNAPVVHFLPKGEGVTVLNKQDGWAYILVNEISGWCMTEMLSETKPQKSSDLLNEQAVVSCVDTVSVYAESNTDSDVVFTIETGTSVHVLIKKGEFVYIDSHENRGWIHRDFLVYDLDKVKPLYCRQDYIDEMQAAIDASREIAEAFIGKKVRGKTEMELDEVIDFHIDASNLYFDVHSHSSPSFFEEQVYYVNDYCMVRDSRFETIADVYEMFYCYFNDEYAGRLCSVIFEYNGAIYADMLDIGGCTYFYDEYDYTVTALENCYNIEIYYDSLYGTLSGTCSIIYEDGIWVSTGTPPVLPP